MPSEIRRLTPAQFDALLQSAAPSLTRKIVAIHLHHTWRPNHAQFKGQSTIEAMRKYHVETNHWNDIAQHLTIDPQGFAWTGRNWNSPPASQSGRNGTTTAGPFMIEMVGDFDEGHDVLDGDQRACVISVLTSLFAAFRLTPADIFFHRELGSPKTCPGTGVKKEVLLADLASAAATVTTTSGARALKPVAAKRARGAAAKEAPPFPPSHWLGHEVTLPVEPPPDDYEAWQVPEHAYASGAIAEDADRRVRALLGDNGRNLEAAITRASTWDALRPYVVNLTKGRLSQGGEFTMPPGAIDAIIESIAQYAETTDEPRLMLHAHGGLVGERPALTYALGAKDWWRDHRVYPIYFVWETQLFEILKQAIGLARAPLGDARDRVFEAFARQAQGGRIWSAMKESARLASSADAGGGEMGGARTFAEALSKLLKSRPGGKEITLHTVGHSAGAIFHSWLIPELVRLGHEVTSLSLLAPACRTDLFKEKLFPLVTSGQVHHFEMFTMEDDAERDDDLVEPLGITLYGKSLLYLVSRAFEPKRKTPILGLEDLLAADAEVKDLFNNGSRLELSRARGHEPNPATKARKHGCFDNDAATIGSVLTTITGAAPGTPFPVKDAACDTLAEERAIAALSRTASVSVVPGAATAWPIAARATTPRRRALCVGIDSYRDSPLGGCVSDATTWAKALASLQFDVTTVLDTEATRERMLDALNALVQSAQPGDVLVFQYSGHGTQAEDLNGDESDRYDEALVPVDYQTGALLIDDDLADVYRRLPQGAVLTLFMDCCHSGTNSRFLPIGRPSAAASERVRFMRLSPEVEAAHRRLRAAQGSPEPTTAEESLPGIIHFAACLDNQYSYESNGQGHFTRIAAPALAAAVAGATTNEAFGNDVATGVIALGRPQTPRLMRLPAELTNAPLLAGAPAAALAYAAGPIAGDTNFDEWCLQFFEAGAAHWRQRLGR